jgi:pimeloyl-ACP methyl ester carboxylesterase
VVLERDGTRLAICDFGGNGPAVLFLHGLAGHAAEWAPTARALVPRYRAVAFDARGHGGSVPRPVDVSPAAHVADTAFVIESLGLAPVVIVGQSLGGVTAFLTAAAHPELVRALVVVEAGPDAPSDPDAFVADVMGRLPAWAASKPEWPPFDPAVMARTLRAAAARAYYAEWDMVSCPRIVVTRDDIPGAGHDLHLDHPAEWQALLLGFLERHAR